jgi:hypothetical protein
MTLDPIPIMHPTINESLQRDPNKMGKEELRAYVARLKTLQKKDIAQIIEDESLGRPEYLGFVYILSNPAMPGILKIGSTSGLVEKRAAELFTTGVPGGFKIEMAFPVYENPREAEKKVHDALDFYREAQNREFFRLPAEEAVILIQAELKSKT